MSNDTDKLMIKIGQSFEANATGRLPILIVFVVICIITYASLK
jgi:hypothetical protein